MKNIKLKLLLIFNLINNKISLNIKLNNKIIIKSIKNLKEILLIYNF